MSKRNTVWNNWKTMADPCHYQQFSPSRHWTSENNKVLCTEHTHTHREFVATMKENFQTREAYSAPLTVNAFKKQKKKTKVDECNYFNHRQEGFTCNQWVMDNSALCPITPQIRSGWQFGLSHGIHNSHLVFFPSPSKLAMPADCECIHCAHLFCVLSCTHSQANWDNIPRPYKIQNTQTYPKQLQLMTNYFFYQPDFTLKWPSETMILTIHCEKECSISAMPKTALNKKSTKSKLI